MGYYIDTLREILPYNADVYLLIGARGLGKTFGVRQIFVEDYIKNKIRFAVIFRSNEVKKKVSHVFFDKLISAGLFEKYVFKTDTTYAYIAEKPKNKKNKIKWSICGYFVSLSTAQNDKQIAAFDRVRNICVDEILIKTTDIYHRYLPNEVDMVADLIDTVTRERPDSRIVENLRKPRVFMLGNAVDLFNPYFERYGIKEPPKAGKYWLKNKTCLFVFSDDKDYGKEKAKNTVAGRMRSAEENQQNSDNLFITGNDDFIVRRPHKHIQPQFIFKWRGKKITQYTDYECGYIYLSDKPNNIKDLQVFALTTSDNKLNYLAGNLAREYMKNLLQYYSAGMLRYANHSTQNSCIEIFRNYGIKE